jgi:hypothetical protein
VDHFDVDIRFSTLVQRPGISVNFRLSSLHLSLSFQPQPPRSVHRHDLF